MMTVVVKPIDEYKSKKFKGKVLSEYIVYQMINGMPIKADTALGDNARDILIAKYLKENKNKK